MSENSWTKATGGRSRAPKDEVRTALLETALAHVQENGLTVGFDHLSLDDLVR